MKSGGPLRRTPMNRAKKRINPRSPKKVAYSASQDGKASVAYMGKVKGLPCCICGASAPSEAHHCRSNGMARDNWKTIPLCIPCHTGPNGYHAAKRSWHEANGFDYDYIDKTRKLVGETT